MMRTPQSTYRLQIRASFDLDAAAGVTDYLEDLGVSWAYLSPLLQATTGSDHGYDVVDPSRIDPARGGAEGFAHFVDAARAHHLGVLVDIVPNHQGVSAPAENPWWWDVLTRGRQSEVAEAFDIDWDFGNGRVRVPILGADLDEVIAQRQIRIEPAPGDNTPYGRAQYFDHILPLAPGTAPDEAADDPAAVRTVLDRQHWELMFWRREASELNFRRFFAVTTLAGVRVEVPWVFEKTHAEILRWVREGLVDGLRVDHPDGLADPGGYLDDLAAATGGVYVLGEKILEHGERLPSWWHTAGTTGYDAMAEIDRVLIDPAGEEPLTRLDAHLRADTDVPDPGGYAETIHETKRMIADTIQVSEIRRLVRLLPDALRERLGVDVAQDAFAELLTAFPVYRSYLPAGAEHLRDAADAAIAHRPDLASPIHALVPLIADDASELSRRFMQTTGPVMAKGVEDTAFYRYTRIGSLTEVGGDPGVFALSVAEFHDAFGVRQSSWPHAMTALSTHDTKRGEDVRARLDVLAEIPDEWAQTLSELRAVASTGHGPFDNLLWQAIIGAWPLSAERLHAYAEKASREAAEATGWWDPDEAFEARMHNVVDAAFGPARSVVQSFVDRVAPLGWSNSLSAKLLQLAGPGVPDVYQGSELWETSLVDPDNRRAVDFSLRRSLLARIDEGWIPPIDESGAAKLRIVSRALRLRRDEPGLFDRYLPATVVGESAEHAVAFDRGGVVAVATRLPVGLAARGGWGDTVLLHTPEPVVDVLTGQRHAGGELALGAVLETYPVALLVAERSS